MSASAAEDQARQQALRTREQLLEEIVRQARERFPRLKLEEAIAEYLKTREGAALHARWLSAPNAPTTTTKGKVMNQDEVFDKIRRRAKEEAPHLSEAEAVTRFISGTDEGRKLHQQYLAASPAKRPSGTPSLTSITITHPMEGLSKVFHDRPELHATYRGQFSDAPLMAQAQVMAEAEAAPVVALLERDGLTAGQAVMKAAELIPGWYEVRRELLNAASTGPAVAWRLLKDGHPDRLRRVEVLADAAERHVRKGSSSTFEKALRDVLAAHVEVEEDAPASNGDDEGRECASCGLFTLHRAAKVCGDCGGKLRAVGTQPAA